MISISTKGWGAAAALAGAALLATVPASAKVLQTDNGQTCTVVNGQEQANGANGNSTTVTAGSGGVTSSTTINGQTTTVHSNGSPSVSSSAGSSVTTGSGGTNSSSSASTSGPEGTTTITRASDGTCIITKTKP
ncbi:MAG TPA: hypothetical protein VFJ18_09435 [Pararhizobium sp.]|nr:hypothetical protein [Pararhizobium sp.]